MSIVEVRGIGHCFPSNCCCCLACALMRNAIGPPRARATIEVGIAGSATFLPEDPSPMSGSVVLPAFPVVIVLATVIPSVAIVVFIVGVLPVALLSSCSPCPHPDHRRRCLARCCHCRGCVRSLPPCPPSPSLVAVVVIDVSACCRSVHCCCVARCCYRAVVTSTLLCLT